MTIFRYITQGFGWAIGSHVAKEGIEALERDHAESAPPSPPPSARELARRARLHEREAARLRKQRDAAEARQRAEIEAQLAALKTKVKR